MRAGAPPSNCVGYRASKGFGEFVSVEYRPSSVMETKTEEHGATLHDDSPTPNSSSSSSSHPDPHSQLTTLTAAATPFVLDMTSAAYGQPAATSYSHDVNGDPYYPDYDWSHQQHGQSLSSLPADPHAYFGFTERPDLVGAGATGGMPLYPGFSSSSAPTDLYGGPSASALWGHHTLHHHNQHHLHQHSQQPHHLLEEHRHTHYMPALTPRGSGPTCGASSSPSSSSSGSGKPKRRRVQSVPQRKAANIRERRRMFHLNTAFDELRKRLPAFNYEKRLSRIETLRLAMTYIGFMKDVSMGQDPRKVKLRAGTLSDAGSDLSQVDLESCASDDQTDDLDN